MSKEDCRNGLLFVIDNLWREIQRADDNDQGLPNWDEWSDDEWDTHCFDVGDARGDYLYIAGCMDTGIWEAPKEDCVEGENIDTTTGECITA